MIPHPPKRVLTSLATKFPLKVLFILGKYHTSFHYSQNEMSHLGHIFISYWRYRHNSTPFSQQAWTSPVHCWVVTTWCLKAFLLKYSQGCVITAGQHTSCGYTVGLQFIKIPMPFLPPTASTSGFGVIFFFLKHRTLDFLPINVTVCSDQSFLLSDLICVKTHGPMDPSVSL